MLSDTTVGTAPAASAFKRAALPSGGAYIARAAVNSSDIRSSVCGRACSPKAASSRAPPVNNESSTNGAAFGGTPTSASSVATEPLRDRSAISGKRDSMRAPEEPIRSRSPSPTSHIVPSGKTDEKV